MAGKNITVEILKQIRDELRTTNAKLDETKTELSERIDALERRQVATETRLATELVAVAHAIGEVKDLLRTAVDVRPKIDDHERRITALEQRP
jgi:predicted  nucleic acid-binding Zn-ribbon protein